MSFLSNTHASIGAAENAFRDAFARLKGGCPRLLPVGTPLSQNNVAREAGRDPSALKKARFPELVCEIQQYLGERRHAKVRQESGKSLQAKCLELENTVASLLVQRDKLASELLSAKYKIFEQWQKIQRLEASEACAVIDFKGR